MSIAANVSRRGYLDLKHYSRWLCNIHAVAECSLLLLTELLAMRCATSLMSPMMNSLRYLLQSCRGANPLIAPSYASGRRKRTGVYHAHSSTNSQSTLLWMNA